MASINNIILILLQICFMFSPYYNDVANYPVNNDT